MSVLLVAVAMHLAHSETIAWWHFDEEDAGTVAQASTVACDQAPDTYANVYSFAGPAKTENSGGYLPRYARPFAGMKVYDPVTGVSRVNRSAMQFTTARGGDSASSNTGRAYYGGALRFGNGNVLYSGIGGKSSFTVECFVCSTGGVYYTFAPIVGALVDTSFTQERYAIYMFESGTIGLRFRAGGNTSIWYGDGTAKVNDGLWHHVAFTYDGNNVRIYVDYVLERKNGSGDRVYSKTGAIDAYPAGTATWIGGYNFHQSGSGGRRFPGYIDEVRVSDVALTPDRFLRLQPASKPVCEDEVLNIRFENATGTLQCQYAESVSEDFSHQGSLKINGTPNSTSFDNEDRAGDSMHANVYADDAVANNASFSLETNAVGKASFIEVPNATDLLGDKDNTNHNYTIECFFKARRSSVRGNQTILKLGKGSAIAAQAMFNGSDRLLFCYSDNGAWNAFGSGQTDLADGEWHHVAFVSDASNRQVRAYCDYRLADIKDAGCVKITKGLSLYLGANENGVQSFDGWLDDCRITKRALSPEQFLTAHAAGSASPNPLLLARFENSYKMESLEDDALSITGTGEARTGGNAPEFVRTSPGRLLLDGTGGSEVVVNDHSVYLNKSRIVFPVSRLYENDSYTVEFWSKFTGIAEGHPYQTFSGPHAGILRLVQGNSSAFDWYLYRHGGAASVLGLAIRQADGISVSYLEWSLPNAVADGKWHHCAITFNPSGNSTAVQLYYDYKPLGEKTVNARIYSYPGGHRLLVGESSGETLNIQGYINSLRISRGVLPPERFLGLLHWGYVISIR